MSKLLSNKKNASLDGVGRGTNDRISHDASSDASNDSIHRSRVFGRGKRAVYGDSPDVVDSASFSFWGMGNPFLTIHIKCA